MVSRDIRRILTQRAQYFNIVLDDVSITQLTFSRDYTAAVESKQVAQQDAERAKFVVRLRARAVLRAWNSRVTASADVDRSPFLAGGQGRAGQAECHHPSTGRGDKPAFVLPVVNLMIVPRHFEKMNAHVRLARCRRKVRSSSAMRYRRTRLS